MKASEANKRRLWGGQTAGERSRVRWSHLSGLTRARTLLISAGAVRACAFTPIKTIDTSDTAEPLGRDPPTNDEAGSVRPSSLLALCGFWHALTGIGDGRTRAAHRTLASGTDCYINRKLANDFRLEIPVCLTLYHRCSASPGVPVSSPTSAARVCPRQPQEWGAH
ncbi:hypothetical protein Bbelb_225020 [Branchiostoma belcheri]|nr:hypothetical protein Bbelb_225020 [Branchiostoma belcheri]